MLAGVMQHDNANAGVIAQSAESHTLVRFYFRPLTPTQYINEGIKPVALRGSAHCPVPVFFFFDLEKLLRREGTRFSQGGMNKRAPDQPTLYTRPQDLKRLPATEIYSVGSYNKETHGHLKDRRHAEIVTADPLPIDHYLAGVVCRSPAERETLLESLSERTRRKYERKTFVYSTAGLFYRRWPYVEAVDLSEDGVVRFRMSPEYEQQGVFQYELRLRSLPSEIDFAGQGSYDYTKHLPLRIRTPAGVTSMRIQLLFDGCTAFLGQRSLTTLA